MNPRPQKADTGWGSAIGILIIVGLLIAGGVYFFLENIAHEPAAPNTHTIQ